MKINAFVEDLKTKSAAELKEELVAAKKELFNLDFTATLDVTRHSDTGSLDLIGTNPARFHCNDTIFTVFEIAGVSEEVAREALRLATHKLPCKCKVVSPRNCLRRFTLFGINMIYLSPSFAAFSGRTSPL